MGDRSSSKLPTEHILKVLNQLKDAPSELQDGESMTDSISMTSLLIHVSTNALLIINRILLPNCQANAPKPFSFVNRERLANDDDLLGNVSSQRSAIAGPDVILCAEAGKHCVQCSELCKIGVT
jgi:hypothetical protein